MKKLFVSLVLIFGLSLAAFGAHAASGQTIQVAGREVTYWVPAAAGPKQPLILFSHGFAGCATQSLFLTEALAQAGYWVFAPNHDDAVCGVASAKTKAPPDKPFEKPELWDNTTYAERGDDLRDLLYALQRDPQFKDRIDFSRIGLVGHSLGGYTALGVAGAWPRAKMSGVKAVLALSPFAEPFDLRHTLAKLKIPVMYQGGTRDSLMTPAMLKQGGVYDQTPAPKYFVEFDRANHFAWTNQNRSYHASIVVYSVAFLDHYVKGRPPTPALTALRGDVADLRYDSDVGHRDSTDNGN